MEATSQLRHEALSHQFETSSQILLSDNFSVCQVDGKLASTGTHFRFSYVDDTFNISFISSGDSTAHCRQKGGCEQWN